MLVSDTELINFWRAASMLRALRRQTPPRFLLGVSEERKAVAWADSVAELEGIAANTERSVLRSRSDAAISDAVPLEQPACG